MNRKGFIKTAGAAAAFYPFLGALSSCNVKRGGKENRIFILVQLVGGNDGLNTLIPLDNYKNIREARPNLFIPENKVIGLGGTSATGLHPSLGGIRDMYDNNLINFVQAVGYENPSYSHFRSLDIWLTGSEASTTLYTGWMARGLQTRFNNYPQGFPNPGHPDPPAIKIGDTGSLIFEGNVMDLSIVIDPSTTFDAPEIDQVQDESNSFAGQEIKSIREILIQTSRYSNVIRKALGTSMTHSELYPKQGENSLADQFKVVARLIKGGLQTPVYMVDLKGFDTHDRQVDPSDTTKGEHAGLLNKVSQAITCFWDDINKIGRENDVAGMVFSEFGRRIKSNASHGTDHGSSQPLIFFGANINKGIIGTNPVVPDKVTPVDNLAYQFDHRTVYSSVLRNWMGVPAERVKNILPGNFPEIEIFKS